MIYKLYIYGIYIIKGDSQSRRFNNGYLYVGEPQDSVAVQPIWLGSSLSCTSRVLKACRIPGGSLFFRPWWKPEEAGF